MRPAIRDAYISVEIADRALEALREGLKSMFSANGVACEVASSATHVSIAYGDGDVEHEALDRVASEIASLPFSVRVEGFELLEGRTTPFDYLVIRLDDDSIGAAATFASGCMKTRVFDGGFRSHISLLKFPKGSMNLKWAERVISEMNASHAAANALGRRVLLKGASVTVFTADRQCHLSKAIFAA